MRAEELIKEGEPQAALAALTEEVRRNPAEAKLRVFLCQLLCVLGQWERALTQLSVAAELDALAIPMKQVYGDAILCEGVRADIFAGKRAPMVFGQPDQWLALLIESGLRAGRGEMAAAAQLRQQAFDEAPESAGDVDGHTFEWLADSDMRLGPVTEAFINGRYYWIPFSRLSQIKIEPPEDLRDAVWTPAHLQFSNGGESLALIPTRYSNSHASDSGKVQLARETQWQEIDAEMWIGLGQRVWATADAEYALMDIREVNFRQSSED